MKSLLLSLRDGLGSMKLTVALLAFSIALVFIATLDQVNLGIWAVQEKYFRSFVVYSRVGDFLIPVFPGGYVVGGLLLANLIASYGIRFGLSLRRLGPAMVHFGLILLLIGELVSGLFQKDSHMRIDEGQTKNYAESFRSNELVFIDITDPNVDRVVAIPEALLAKKQGVQHPKLPFRVQTREYFANSDLHRHGPSHGPALATAGFGTSLDAVPAPLTHREDERNLPSAFVELTAGGQSLGTYLVSLHLMMPQEFTHEGRTWRLALRTARIYYPFSLTLLEFTHDKYPGTNIPKNFSSKLHLKTPDGRDDRDVLVYMNNPLRYGGYTFYQSGFDNNDTTSILQVVRNPSWLIPYVATVLMSIGLMVQFGLHLFRFATRRRQPAPATRIPQPVPELAEAAGR